MQNIYKKNLLHRLKIARGHFDKVIQMVDNDEYCLDITQQTYAIQNAIKKIEEVILEHHLKTCVKEAIVSDKQVDEKVKEILEVFKRK
ncbi:metal-sensing transcriptional repressor [Candidatus Roizmanbacteria bacterium]|nr:metal-sensing transcriptional repressor [Candidatus Roizmanbacteria bacterium]